MHFFLLDFFRKLLLEKIIQVCYLERFYRETIIRTKFLLLLLLSLSPHSCEGALFVSMSVRPSVFLIVLFSKSNGFHRILTKLLKPQSNGGHNNHNHDPELQDYDP